MDLPTITDWLMFAAFMTVMSAPMYIRDWIEQRRHHR